MILLGDFNRAPACERLGYSLPLIDSLCKADDSLQDFCQDTGGDPVFPNATLGVGGNQVPRSTTQSRGTITFLNLRSAHWHLRRNIYF